MVNEGLQSSLRRFLSMGRTILVASVATVLFVSQGCGNESAVLGTEDGNIFNPGGLNTLGGATVAVLDGNAREVIRTDANSNGIEDTAETDPEIFDALVAHDPSSAIPGGDPDSVLPPVVVVDPNDRDDANTNGSDDSKDEPVDSNTNGSGGGADPIPTLPAPKAAFVAYTPDGALDVNSTIVNAAFRSRIIATFPQLSAYGFGRYVTPLYMSIARNQETADAYFAPLIAAGAQNNIQFVPGFWLHDVMANIHGLATLPPWNVTGSLPHLNHPMNPTAMGQQAFWDEFVRVTRVMSRGAQCPHVFVDAEFVFWHHRDDAFFSDSNMAVVKPMIREAIRTLRDEGIFVSMYHPYMNPFYNPIKRIANGLFRPENSDDPLNAIEHMVPAPYYSAANWTLWEADQIKQSYVDEGFNGNAVRFGMASEHINGGGLYGFNPAQLDNYLSTRPGVFNKIWYFTSHTKFEAQAASFAGLAP